VTGLIILSYPFKLYLIMRKYVSLIFNISLLVLCAQAFISCKKEAEPAPVVYVTVPTPVVNVTVSNPNSNPNTSTSPIQAEINGTIYAALSPLVLSSYSSWFSATSHFPIAAKGSYAAFTFHDKNYTYFGFPYSLVISQSNISNRDTVNYTINVYSSVPIVPGSYQIWADTFYTYDPPVDVNTFAIADAFSTLNNSYGDSTSVGTITIDKLDLINKEATGSFSFINYGYNYKGVVPYTAVSNGKFTDLGIQTF
jgi:hypothetical protein